MGGERVVHDADARGIREGFIDHPAQTLGLLGLLGMGASLGDLRMPPAQMGGDQDKTKALAVPTRS
jgi:hypothetical protein